VTPATMGMDAPTKFTYGYKQVYEPGNFGDSYANKPIPVRTALKSSKNVPTVEIATQVGLANVAATAERAGLPKPDAYPSMALGTSEATPLEIAMAYTAFARGGTGVAPTPVTATEEGDSVTPARAEPRQVFSPQVAYVMTDMLEDVVSGGTGAAVRAHGLKGAIAGKTGTSHDGWFVGYTPNMVCAVWVGFDDNRQLGLTGAESALPIWAEFVKKAVAFRPDLGGDAFPRPSGISRAAVCDESGLIAGEYCSSKHEEIFISGTEPSGACTGHMPQLASSDLTVPLFDDEGHFIGYGPDTGSSYVPKAATRDRAYGEDEDEDDEDTRKDDGVYHPRRPEPPAVRTPGMIKLPPAHDEDDDEDDEDDDGDR
jgi:penicillin-binding protein 1B